MKLRASHFLNSKIQCFSCISLRYVVNLNPKYKNFDSDRVSTTIKVPQKWVKNAQNQQQREEEWKGKFIEMYGVDKSKALRHISFKPRTEYNHYVGQRYPLDQMPLATEFWHKPKYKEYSMTINPVEKVQIVQDSFGFYNFVSSFDRLSLCPLVLKSIHEMGLKRPTVVQSRAIPSILSGKHTFLAAEAGAGKTVAFGAPIISHIWNNMQTDKEESSDNENLITPKALIIVPSIELRDQIHGVLTNLSKETGLHVIGEMDNLDIKDCDIMIVTPGRLSRIMDFTRPVLQLEKLQFVVLDEADTLTDHTFVNVIDHILHKITLNIDSSGGSFVSGAQLILSAATIPKDLEEFVTPFIPFSSLNQIFPDRLHQVQSHVKQIFLRVRERDKPEKLLEMVKNDIKNGRQTIVFCKNITTTDFVCGFLNNWQVKAKRLHAKSDANERKIVFQNFIAGECKVLVATDHSSRGLDTIKVSHVINYDFPWFMSNYLHRAGRCGRVGSKASHRPHVTSFIRTARDVELLNQIEMSVRRGEDLPDVDANIKRQLDEKNEEIEQVDDVSEDM